MKQFLRLFGLLALGWAAGCAPQPPVPVNLFVTADMEGVYWSRPEPRYDNETVGGLAVLKSFLDKQTEPFLLLEGGNWFAQTPEGTLFSKDYLSSLSEQLPYAARLFTEQDLAYGWGPLSHFLKDSPAPFILSNVTLKGGYWPAGSKRWLLSQVGEYKIGIIGLVSPRAVRGPARRGGLVIADPLETVRELVPQLREKGAQAIVVLSGLGQAENENAVTDFELAEEISGIDVIVRSGLGSERAAVHRVGGTWLVYPGSRLASVAKVQLLFTQDGALANIKVSHPVLYRRDFGEDETVAAETEKLRQAARSQLIHRVGKSAQEMSGRSDGESALGNWAADCLRKWAKADAAVLNASALRSSLPAGPVTQYDLYNVYPYNDHVTYLTIKGAALQQALEKSLSVADNFPQIAGLQIKYRPDAAAGRRISAVKINNAPLLPTATYRVAVPDGLLSGGAGHDGFIDSLEFKNTQVEMRTVLRLCLAGKQEATPPALGRWSVVK